MRERKEDQGATCTDFFRARARRGKQALAHHTYAMADDNPYRRRSCKTFNDPIHGASCRHQSRRGCHRGARSLR